MRRAAITVGMLCYAPVATMATAQEPKWYTSNFNGVLQLAGREGRSALVYFWMDGSQHCANFWSETLANVAERERLGNFVCFSANATQADGASLVSRYNVTALPTVLVVAPNGQVDDAIVGYVPSVEFDTQIDRILAGTNTVSALRDTASQSPEDLSLRFDLALKLAYVGDLKTSEILFESIRDADPRGVTLGGAKIAVRDVAQTTVRNAKDATDAQTWDLEPMRALLARLAHPAAQFQGWDWIAGVERSRGNNRASRDAYRHAAAHVPPDRTGEWPATVSLAFFQMRAELDADERRFVRELVDEHYGKVYAEVADIADPAQIPDAQRGEQAFQITCVARGLFLDGRVTEARAAVQLALRMEPQNEEHQALLQSIER